MKNNCRAFFIAPVVYWIVGLGVGTQVFLPSWRLPALFSKGSGAAELAKAQAEARAKGDAADLAVAHYNSMISDFEAKKRDLLGNSQFNLAGVPKALAGEPQTPGVMLATRLAINAATGLKDAIGDLPAAKQEAIAGIVSDILSASAERVKRAEDALAVSNHERDEANKAKDLLAVQLPAVKAQAEAAVSAKGEADKLVETKTAVVANYAKQAEKDKEEAGGLKAFGENILKLLALTALIAGCFGALWLYEKFHSVGIAGLASVVSDIRAGVNPIQAIDTITSPRIQKKVAAIATPAPAAGTTTTTS